MELIETHISWVFLSEDWVWKLKKPLNLGFLDFTSLAARKAACEQEVILNRRLSSGVYQGVYQVVEDAPNTLRLMPLDAPINPPGQLRDYAVKMRRLPDKSRADILLMKGQLTQADVKAIARRLSQFHEDAQVDESITQFGALAQILANVEENFAQARPLALRYISSEEHNGIEQFQSEFLAQSGELLKRRMAQGRIRDGHGDLRLEHIYIQNQDSVPSFDIIDCIEFNERFRYGDVCCDLVFLAMDLRHHERADLAELLLAEYALSTGDFDLYAVCDFYESYRAYVRAKVASFLAQDDQAATPARALAGKVARAFYLHALSASHTSLTDCRLILVAGVIASGKSTVSAKLSTLLCCPVVESDRTRKTLRGLAHTTRLPRDSYAPEVSDKVYDAMINNAKTVLASGRSVIVDTTFKSRHLRQRFISLAGQHGVDCTLVLCNVSQQTALDRLRQRKDGQSVSDARETEFEACLAAWEPLSEQETAICVKIDSGVSSTALSAELERVFADSLP